MDDDLTMVYNLARQVVPSEWVVSVRHDKFSDGSQAVIARIVNMDSDATILGFDELAICNLRSGDASVMEEARAAVCRAVSELRRWEQNKVYSLQLDLARRSRAGAKSA